MAVLTQQHAELLAKLQEALDTESDPELLEEYAEMVARIRSYVEMGQPEYEEIVAAETRMQDKMDSGFDNSSAV